VSCLQESSDGTNDSQHGSTSLGGSAGELGRSRLGGGGSSSASGVGWDSGVLGWVRNDRRSNAGGLDGGGGWLDWVAGGVLAVVVNDGGGLGDGVGLGADGQGGGLRADGGESLDGGGGVAGVVGSWGGASSVVSSGAGAGGVVTSGGRSNRGGVLGWVAVGQGVDSSGKADDSEGTHLDCWGDY